MTNENCIALSNVETRLAIHLTSKRENNINKKRNVKMNDSLLRKLINPETKEFYNLKRILRPISKVGQISTISSASLACFMLFSAVCNDMEGNFNDIEKYDQMIKFLFRFGVASGIISSPFIVMDAIQQEISDKYKYTQEKERVELEQYNLERKTLERTLKLVKELKTVNPEFKFNFARSLLNSVDISKNTPEYNEKLLIILSKIAEEESLENLEELAEHLDSKKRVNQDNASGGFLNNETVKQLVKSYSKKRS